MCSRTLNNRFSVSLEQFQDLSHSSQHKSDHVSNLHKTSQCLPLVRGIKSFKAHHELALPPPWPHLPGAPSPITQGVPATVTFSLCQDMPWVPPSPAHESALLFLWQELSPGKCLLGSVAHFAQFSVQMPSPERDPSSTSSLRYPMLTLHLSLLFHFLHSPYHYLKICTYWLFTFFVVCPPF